MSIDQTMIRKLNSIIAYRVFFFLKKKNKKLGFTPCKAEHPHTRHGVTTKEAQKKEKKITGYRKSV